MESQSYLRKDTIKFTFDRSYVRPKPLELKIWLSEKVRITQDDIEGVHLSFVQCAMYVKLKDPTMCNIIVDRIGDRIKFNHSDGHVSDVLVCHAGLGIRTVRVFELPFEVPAEAIDDAFKPYGRVISNVAEKWAEAHMFPVLNGVRQVKIELLRHLPSYMNICGYRALIIYDGQPRTCALCGSTGHVRAECKKKRVAQLPSAEEVTSGPVTAMKLTYAAAAVSPKRPERALSDQGTASTQQIVALGEHEISPVAKRMETKAVPYATISSQNETPSEHLSDTLRDESQRQSTSAFEQNAEDTTNLSHNDVAQNVAVVEDPQRDSATSAIIRPDNINRVSPEEAQNVDGELCSRSLSVQGKDSSPKQAIESQGEPSTRTENLRSPILPQELSEKSPDVSSEKSLTKSPKKSNKRRIAHQAAESIAPAIREKLRNIKEGPRTQKKESAMNLQKEKQSQTSHKSSSAEKQMTLDPPTTEQEERSRLRDDNQEGRKEWADEVEDQDPEREDTSDMDFY